MYIPKHFGEEDTAVLQAFMQQYSFAALVTVQDGIPVANHFPFLVDTQRGPYGTLRAHMARTNPQWRGMSGMQEQEALVIFQGPHAYISPSWYVDNLASSVPTWNYAVVHAYGVPHIVEDPLAVYDIIRTTVQENESQFEDPWALDMPDEELRLKIQAIVGFEIEITRLEGKFKLSQNRSATDRARVIATLEESLSPGNTDAAELMASREKKGQ
jgi:transcriptional regulator